MEDPSQGVRPSTLEAEHRRAADKLLLALGEYALHALSGSHPDRRKVAVALDDFRRTLDREKDLSSER